MDPLKTTIGYHQATKHHFNRFARSAGYLDWTNQPDPLRRFAGSAITQLPVSDADDSPPYASIFAPESASTVPLELATIARFLEDALAVSAWKEHGGERWALRCNPSSGNLHPTEGYLIAGPLTGLPDAPAVYHYAPKEHALERRASLTPESWASLCHGFPPDTFFVGLSSIHWREAWKYGERAFRYCQHDVGHALAALVFSAACLGRRLVVLEGLADADIAVLLGLDRTGDFNGAEAESPDLIAAVIPADCESLPRTLAPEAIPQVASAEWAGHANALSADHLHWPIIDAVASATQKPPTQPRPWHTPSSEESHLDADDPPARRLIRQRRSAQSMDGRSAMAADSFYRLLRRLLPRSTPVPWNSLAGPARIHLVFFIHRIDGLSPGLYAFPRTVDAAKALRTAMKPAFHWTPPRGCPDDLPLHFLVEGDCRAAAGQLSCGQEIASEGAFCVAMLADFEEPLKRPGPWMYRRLFWESGMIGQVLYLEAERAGLRGTGIGCYFDDPTHNLLGLSGLHYQSLYHFTLGGPVDDPRLTTLPPYPHLKPLPPVGR